VKLHLYSPYMLSWRREGTDSETAESQVPCHTQPARRHIYEAIKTSFIKCSTVTFDIYILMCPSYWVKYFIS
jgi:hypothetical protein